MTYPCARSCVHASVCFRTYYICTQICIHVHIHGEMVGPLVYTYPGVSLCFCFLVSICPFVYTCIQAYTTYTYMCTVCVRVRMVACVYARASRNALVFFSNKMNFLFEGFKLHFVWHLNQVLGLGKGRGSRCVRMCLLVCGIHV